MSWLSVSFEIGADEVDAVTDALLEAGALAVEVEDAQAGTALEEPVFAEGVTVPGAWRRNLVHALLEPGADAAAIVAQACKSAGVAPPAFSSCAVPERDWVRATQAQFEPIRISARLWIVPSWRVPPDPAAVNVILDPGIAFGTGTHPTTRLCLAWLASVITGGESVLDYGCGSGILAIAALKLGAARATGIDIDPQALLAARGNAIQNRADIEFRAAADRSGAAVDVVIANILAHPLIVLAPALAALARPGGRLALSGILAEQAEEVRAAYAQWFDLAADGADDGWVLLAGTRK